MRRWGAPLALVLLAGCTTTPSTVDGGAGPPKVIGATQTSTVDVPLDVTPLALVDPAPVSEEYEHVAGADEGARLVAVQFRVTNAGAVDKLIGPGGLVRFRGSDGKDYGESVVETSAGAMLDQLQLA